MAYATRTELADYLSDDITLPAAAEQDRLLDRASEVVDGLLVASIYDVDSNGDPTDTDHIAGMRDATCAVVEDWLVTGDEHDVAGRYSSVSIGSVNLTRAAGRGHVRRIPQRALWHLQQAGLSPGTPEL